LRNPSPSSARQQKTGPGTLDGQVRFSREQARLALVAHGGQIEWLLQVLNDVRIGAWLAIGSPDGQLETIAIFNEKTAPYFWAMEVSGHFQAVLLKAIDCGVSADLE